MTAAVCSAYQAHVSSLAASITPRKLVSTHGSGNYGESGSAAFYTIDELPKALTKDRDFQKELKKVDIDLGPDRQAFIIDNVLTADESDALAACAEAILEANGHSRVAPGIRTPPGMRINEVAHWYPPYGSSFLPSIFRRIEHLVPQTVGDGLPLYPKLSEKIAHFKYNKGDKFNRHIDGLFPGQGANPKGNGVDEWTGVVWFFASLLPERCRGWIGGWRNSTMVQGWFLLQRYNTSKGKSPCFPSGESRCRSTRWTRSERRCSKVHGPYQSCVWTTNWHTPSHAMTKIE